jgi:hypothetical protein
MAKKIDLSRAKDFLFNHGEKVALGTCAFLALFFGTMGFLRALSASKDNTGKSWVEAFKDRQSFISSGMNSAEVPKLAPEQDAMLDPKHYEWHDLQSKHQPLSYFFLSEKGENGRNNPMALPIRSGPKNIQLEYLRRLVLVHEVKGANVMAFDAAGGAAPAVPQPKPPKGQKPAMPAGGPQELVHAGQPLRFVVGTAIFPMKAQVAEFIRQLRYASQQDIFNNRHDLPRPLGLIVVRYEILPNGQPAKKDGDVLVRVAESDGGLRLRGLDHAVAEIGVRSISSFQF